MKKVIITGANGFIGSALVRLLIEHKIHVIALDIQGRNKNIPQSDFVRFLPADLANISTLKNVITDTDIDVFYHFAWAGSAGADRVNVNLQLNNAKWTADCVILAKELGCKRFVCAGSIMEYETYEANFTQGNQPGQGYIYGDGKLAAHCISKSVAASVGIEHIWAMITNAYGVGELSPRFINTTLRKIIHNEPLQFTSGMQNYDFVYIDDVAKAFYLIGKNGNPFNHYLIGSGNAKPLKEFILELKDSVAPNKEFVFGDVPFTGTNLSLTSFDCVNTQKDTGFSAEISFACGIKKTFDWLKELEGTK